MEISSVSYARTAEGRRISVAEEAVSELNRRLAEWDGQRARLAVDDLGRNPHRHVARTWPSRTAADATSAAQRAAPLSAATIEAECSTLWWSGIGKLIVAAVSITVLLSIPASLILNALG